MWNNYYCFCTVLFSFLVEIELLFVIVRLFFGENIHMNYREFKQLLRQEKDLYFENSSNYYKRLKKSRHKRYYIWRYLYYYRLCQFYRDLRVDNSKNYLKKKIAKIFFKHFEKKRNIYSYKSGVEIGLNSIIGWNCDIWHSGVVINGVLGENCILHGNNVIGNKGIGKENQLPNIGSNVDIGAGAVIIGGVTIADECIVGACSVVTKSFLLPHSIIKGIPGKI